MIAERNKPSEKAAKQSVFHIHLQPMIGTMRLDDIDAAVVQQIRAAVNQQSWKGQVGTPKGERGARSR